MKKIALAFAIVIGFGLAGMGNSHAQAASPFGVHFGSRGLHIDIGNTHRRGHSYYSRGHHRGHSYRGHYDWHDTSHYDWHPGQFYRHGNHFDYVPGHYHLHRSGHYDYHRGRHGCHW